MRYSIAVDRLRSIAETCTRLASLWEDDPLVADAYVFGELLEGGQRPERLQMAFVVDLPPEEVSWYTLPTPMVGLRRHRRHRQVPVRVVLAASALAGLEPLHPRPGSVLVAGRAR